MGDMKAGSKVFTPTTTHTIKPVLGGNSGVGNQTKTTTTCTPKTGNAESYKAAQTKISKELAKSDTPHSSGGSKSTGKTEGSHGDDHHGANPIYGDAHKAHDMPGVIHHKSHMAHGALEGVVVGGEKMAHALGHSKAGHAAHVVEHGAHKLASKLGPVVAVAAIANAVHNPSVKSVGEATSTTLTATKDIMKARSTVAATKAATNVLTQAAGRSGSAVTAAIVKKEAPHVAAAVAKTVAGGALTTAGKTQKVVAATKAATSTLAHAGVSTTARVMTKGAVTAAEAAAKAGAKAGGRFVPGLNIAIAVADGVVAVADAKKAYDNPSAKNVTVAVVSGITAVGSALAATNIPVVSQVGAGVSLVTGLGKAALESFWPD